MCNMCGWNPHIDFGKASSVVSRLSSSSSSSHSSSSYNEPYNILKRQWFPPIIESTNNSVSSKPSPEKGRAAINDALDEFHPQKNGTSRDLVDSVVPADLNYLKAMGLTGHIVIKNAALTREHLKRFKNKTKGRNESTGL